MERNLQKGSSHINIQVVNREKKEDSYNVSKNNERAFNISSNVCFGAQLRGL